MIRKYRFVTERNGQDLVEYVLILAFVVLSGAAIYVGMNRPMQGLWMAMNSRLTNASN